MIRPFFVWFFFFGNEKKVCFERKIYSFEVLITFQVALLLSVEEAIGFKLEQHQHNEDEVLKFLAEANAARRIAVLWWAEEGLLERNEKRKDESRKRRKQSKQQQ
jgi:hypothetical protein